MAEGKRTRIAPTTGAGVVLAVALGALPAALVGLELAWLVVIAAFTTLIVAPVLAWREASAVTDVTPPASLRVHAGRATPVTFELSVQRPCRDLLADVSLTGTVGREREGAPKVAIDNLRPGPPTRVPLIARFTARGTAEQLHLRITSTFPFGLFIATSRRVLPVSIRVLPRLQPRPDVAFLRALRDLSPAGPSTPRSRPLARAGLPIGLRAARSGDRLRDIAWKPSVRQSRWVAFEREGHEAEREITLVLHLGVRGAAASSLRRTGLAFEAAVSHCATAIECLFGRTGSVTLEFDSGAADAPLAEVASGSSANGGPLSGSHRSSVRGAAALMDRLSEVQTVSRVVHDPQESAHPDTSQHSPAKPAGAARPRRTDTDLRIVFIGMSALEYQRATDSPTVGRNGGGTLILGVDASGRVQALWGSSAQPGRPMGQRTELRS